MFQKLTAGSDDDLRFMADTTQEPSRIIAIHNKLHAWKEDGHMKDAKDWTSTPFQLLQVSECRRIMLKFVDKDHSDEENARIRNDRDKHMLKCKPCFVTFSHIAFGGGQDYAFVISVFQTIEDATENAIWDVADGQGFRALDFFGVKGGNRNDRFKPGPCIFVKTGHVKLQGRVAAKIFGGLHVVLVPGAYKDTVDHIAINLEDVDMSKFTFFNEALKCYFLKVNEISNSQTLKCILKFSISQILNFPNFSISLGHLVEQQQRKLFCNESGRNCIQVC